MIVVTRGVNTTENASLIYLRFAMIHSTIIKQYEFYDLSQNETRSGGKGTVVFVIVIVAQMIQGRE